MILCIIVHIILDIPIEYNSIHKSLVQAKCDCVLMTVMIRCDDDDEEKNCCAAIWCHIASNIIIFYTEYLSDYKNSEEENRKNLF